MGNANTVYVAKKAATLTNPVTNDSIFLQSDSSSLAAFVGIPGALVKGTSLIEASPFRVTASGRIHVPTTSTTQIVALYFSTAARTAIAYNTTGSTSVATVTSASMTAAYDTQFYISGTFMWDATSLILNGFFNALTGPTPAVAAIAVTTQVTAVDLSLPGCGFVCGTHLGSSGADTTVTLTNFTLEVL